MMSLPPHKGWPIVRTHNAKIALLQFDDIAVSFLGSFSKLLIHKKQSLAERAKYQFEADSEDEEMENEIDNNLDMLHGATTRLKHLGLAMGEEVDSQNRHIERIGGKVDKVDDEIALNRSRLDRIK